MWGEAELSSQPEVLGHLEDGGQQPSKPGLTTEAWRRAVGRGHRATSTPSDEPPFLLQRHQFQPLKAARDCRAIMLKQSGPRSQSDKISPTELCLPVLLPITAKPVAFWEGLKARKKRFIFSQAKICVGLECMSPGKSLFT